MSESQDFSPILEGGESLTESLGVIVEAALDTGLENDFLKELPVVQSVLGLYSAGATIRERLFMKKLLGFLKASRRSFGPTPAERQKALQHFGGEDQRQRLGETIMLLLDRAEDTRKPPLLGRIVGALLNGDLSYSTAINMCTIVDKIVYDDLSILEDVPQSEKASSKLSAEDEPEDESEVRFGALHRLESHGLVYRHVHDLNDTRRNSPNEFVLSTIGNQLLTFYRRVGRKA